VGFFGPIGVSTIFYLYVSLDYLRTSVRDHGVARADAERLGETMIVVIWFLAVSSIVRFSLALSMPRTKVPNHRSFMVFPSLWENSVSTSAALFQRASRKTPIHQMPSTSANKVVDQVMFNASELYLSAHLVIRDRLLGGSLLTLGDRLNAVQRWTSSYRLSRRTGKLVVISGEDVTLPTPVGTQIPTSDHGTMNPAWRMIRFPDEVKINGRGGTMVNMDDERV
jgi:hypothetical protein